MTLNAYRDEAGSFLEAIGASGEDIGVILGMLDEEIAHLKASLDDDAASAHEVYDVLFLLFEVAARYGLDLDAEWTTGRARKRAKYRDWAQLEDSV